MIDDLIGIPWDAMDCYELARAAADRFGRRVPAIEDAAEVADAGAEAAATLQKIDRAPQAGDLVIMREDPHDTAMRHLGIMVDPSTVLHSVRGMRSRTTSLRQLGRKRLAPTLWELPQW